MNFSKQASVSRLLVICLGLAVTGQAYCLEVPDGLDIDNSAAPGVTVSAVALRTRMASGDQAFTREEGITLGVDHFDAMTPDQLMPPFWYGRGVASGDVNRDGFPDLLLATRSGVRLFNNVNGERFREAPLEIEQLKGMDVFLAAFVDVNNDGWLDIFVGSYERGNYILTSDMGSFSGERFEQLPVVPKVATLAASFGDPDEDGDLDIALGNWYWGAPKPFPPADADNYLLMNQGDGFLPRRLEGIAGETLSMLFSDFNLDGDLDLIVGNDFTPPDHYYLGDGSGQFRLLTRQDGIIPVSTTTTMSIDTGDFDNDLDLDIYVTQIAGGATGNSAKIALQEWPEYCGAIHDDAVRNRCLTAVSERRLFRFGPRHRAGLIKGCAEIEPPERRQGCISTMILRTTTRVRKEDLCERIPTPAVKSKCFNFFVPGQLATAEQDRQSIPSTMNKNVLLQAEAGRFTDTAVAKGVDSTEWSWNSRFWDADNDGWLDIYVVNGIWFREQGTPPKYFFHNQSGNGFVDRTDSFGLQNYMLQSAFTTVDFDRDGDLDMIANSINGPLWIYRNNESRNNAVSIQLIDKHGNHDGIGSRITIHYGKSGELAQVREIKSGGGFLSFDHPEAHFGLGNESRITAIDVLWSTGESSTVRGSLPANSHYTLTREAN